MLVLVDETDTDRRDCMRQFEYSLRGRPAVTQELRVRGQLHVLLECVVMACWTCVGTEEFVEEEHLHSFIILY